MYFVVALHYFLFSLGLQFFIQFGELKDDGGLGYKFFLKRMLDRACLGGSVGGMLASRATEPESMDPGGVAGCL